MDIFEAISNRMKEKKGLKTFLVYGSYADDSFRADSDIDLAYFTDYDKPISKLELLETLLEIESLPELDLVCLNDISPVLAMQIIKNHKILIQNSERDFEKWKLAVFAQAHDLKLANSKIYENLGLE